MGMANLMTHWCMDCDAPTLHRMFVGLDSGEEYAILRCCRCYRQAKTNDGIDSEISEGNDGPKEMKADYSCKKS
jgi:hypothetical protein